MLEQGIQYKHSHLQTKRVFGKQHYKSKWIQLNMYFFTGGIIKLGPYFCFIFKTNCFKKKMHFCDIVVFFHLIRIVSTYLVHHGYCATAEAFAKSTGQSFTEELASIKNRQSEPNDSDIKDFS